MLENICEERSLFTPFLVLVHADARRENLRAA